MVSPCSEGNYESFCGAIGLRVRLLTERLVVRVHPGAQCLFFVSLLIVCLFRSWFSLNLVCHRIYSKSFSFVFFLLANHFVIFFCLWRDIWALNQGTEFWSITIQRKSTLFLQLDNTYLSLILFKSICPKQPARYLRMVSPCCERRGNSSCGAIG